MDPINSRPLRDLICYILGIANTTTGNQLRGGCVIFKFQKFDDKLVSRSLIITTNSQGPSLKSNHVLTWSSEID